MTNEVAGLLRGQSRRLRVVGVQEYASSARPSFCPLATAIDPVRRAFAFAIFIVTLAGCHQEAKGEERSLVAAVDRFRATSDTAGSAGVQMIENAACSDGPNGEICSAKATCLLYARPTADAYGKIASVRSQLDGLADGGASMNVDAMAELKNRLNATLVAARKQLDDGHSALNDCDRALENLRLKYER